MNSKKIKINIDGELEYTQSTGELYTGPSESFYDNGNIQHSGQYENGLMEGIWKYYYPDRKIFAKISHLMGRPSGLNETFYEDGTLSLRGFSEEGKRVGVWTTYNSDGSIEKEEEYKRWYSYN